MTSAEASKISEESKRMLKEVTDKITELCGIRDEHDKRMKFYSDLADYLNHHENGSYPDQIPY